jgi:hypothetical protein
MTSNPPLVRFCAVAAPVLLLLYGVLRFVDGLDGDRGNGPAWTVGHGFFFAAFVLLAVLVVALRAMVPPTTTAGRVVADGATVAGLLGAACFLWVILGDLDVVSGDLPDAVQLVGPLLFQLGALVLMVRLVRAGRLPAWSPVALFLGFVAIAVNLDLLPLGALLIFAGLAPLARRVSRPVRNRADAPAPTWRSPAGRA